MGIDFGTVRRIALALPEVTESLGARGWAFKARGKLLACQAIHRSAETESLVVKIGSAGCKALISENPAVYYLTSHYEGYQTVLVRLKAASEEDLSKLLERSWAFVTGEAEARRSRSRKASERRRTRSPGRIP